MQNPNTIILETKRLTFQHQVIENFDALWAEGRSMTMEQAIGLALR